MSKRNRTPAGAPKPRQKARSTALGVSGLIGLGSLGGLAFGAGGGAYAGPQGGVVTNGSAAIQRQGSLTTITQSSDRASLHWQNFDIGSGETVRFRQPSTSSIALNTILDRKPTEIQGNLSSNGQVWLQNPQGVIFTESANVNVGGLLATTSTIDEAAFAEGRGRIEGAGGQGAVINRGDIAAGSGGVALIAPVVENAGSIEVTGGSAELAAATGFSVDTHGDGLLSVVVDAADAEQLSLINEGTIRAEGGVVRLSAAQAEGVKDSLVHAGGIVEATGIAEVGGEIVITGGTGEGAVALVTGQVSATKGDLGGQIAISATEVRLEQQAVVSVSAPEGGGLIEIGPRAAPVPPKRVAVAAEAALAADATAADGTGDAGEILFWSTESTDFKGEASASARGSGDGGFVDISSAGAVGFDGLVFTDAVSGTPGELLFDPDNIVIGLLATNDGEIADGVVNASDGTGTFYISAAALNTRISTNPGGTTTLAAYQGIGVNEAITIANHTLNLDVGPGDTPSLTFRAPVNMGANSVLNGTAAVISVTETGYFRFLGGGGSSISLDAYSSLSVPANDPLTPFIFASPSIVTGDVDLYGATATISRPLDNLRSTGNTTLAASSSGVLTVGANIRGYSGGGSNGAVLLEGGTVTIDGTVSSDRDITVSAATQVNVNANLEASFTADVIVQELASGNTPNVTVAGANLTGNTGDVLMPTVGTLSIIGGSITGANVDITSDSTIEFRPATLDITGDLDLTSDTSTCFCGFDGGDYDVDGRVLLDAGDGGSAITVEAQGGGNVPLDVGGNFVIEAGTGDVVIGPDNLYVGTGTGGGYIRVDGAAITVTSEAGSGGIDVTAGMGGQMNGGAEIYGTSVAFTANGFTGSYLTLDASAGAARLIQANEVDAISVSGDVDISGATAGEFSSTGTASVLVIGNMSINTDNGGGAGSSASFTNTAGAYVELGGLYVTGNSGTGTITGPVRFGADNPVNYVSLQGDTSITMGGYVASKNPADLSLSSTNVTILEAGGVAEVDVDDIDGVFRNIDVSAPGTTYIYGSDNYFSMSGNLTINPVTAGAVAELYGWFDIGGALEVNATSITVSPDYLATGTTATFTGGTDVGLSGGPFYVSGLTTASASSAGGTVDVTATRLDTLGLDVDATSTVTADIARITSGDPGMTNGSISLVSTGGAVNADIGDTFADVNGDLEIRTPLAIDFDPSDLAVSGNLTLASGTSVTIDNGAEPFFLEVLGDFTIEPTVGAGMVPVSIDQASGLNDINIYTAGNFSITSNGGDILLNADLTGSSAEAPAGVGGNLTINAGTTGGVQIRNDIDGDQLVLGNIDIDGRNAFIVSNLARVEGYMTAPTLGTITIDTAEGVVIGIIEGNFPPILNGSLVNERGDITINAGAGVRLGGDVIAGSAGMYGTFGGDIDVNAGLTTPASGSIFTEASATIEGSEVRLDATAAFTQATVVGAAGGPPIITTIIANGYLADSSTPNLEIEGSSVEIFGTLDVTGDAEITATGTLPMAADTTSAPGTDGLVFIGDQPAGAVNGTLTAVQPAAPGIAGDVNVTGALDIVGGAVSIEGSDTTLTSTGGFGPFPRVDISGTEFVELVDGSVTGPLVRLFSEDGLILTNSGSLNAGNMPTVDFPHPLMVRGADFDISGYTGFNSYATMLGFTNPSSTPSVGGTTGLISNSEFEQVAGGSFGITIISNALPGGGGLTTLNIYDISAPFGGDNSLYEVSFGAGGQINVIGDVSGNGYYEAPSMVIFPGFELSFGTRVGLYGNTTDAVPDNIDISGRIGIVDYTGNMGTETRIEPPDGITFIAENDVTSSTGRTDGSLFIISAGTSVIDVGDGFILENTTGASSPLASGEPASGVQFEALRVDRAARTEIFGTVNGVGGEDARFEVLIGSGFSPNGLTQINDCVIQASSCNRTPTGDDVFGMTDEDMATDPIDVLDGFEDPDGGTLELVTLDGQSVNPGDEIPGPDGGVFIVGSDGTITFDPLDDFQSLMVGETVSFSVAVEVSDGQGGTAAALLTVTIDGANDAPTAMDAAVGTDNDSPAAPVGVDEIGMDIDMDPLSFSEIDGQAVMPGETLQLTGGGTITVLSDGSLVFNPAGQVNGTPDAPAVVVVPVTVSDGNGGLATANIIVTVTGENGAPIGMAGSLTTNEDMPSMVLDTLGLFDDPEMQALELIAIDGTPVAPGDRIAGPEGGVIVIGANGELFFDPVGAFDALDGGEAESFVIDVTVEDAFGARGTAPVTISVLGLAELLALLPGEISTTEDTPSDPLGVGTLAGDGVTGGLTVDAVNGTSVGAGGATVPLSGGGSLIVLGDGSLIFDPGEDFQGLMEGATDNLSVTLTLSDTTGASGTTPVAIDISGLNDIADAAMGRIETTEDMISGGLAPGEIALDPDMDTLAIAEIGGEPVTPGSSVPLGDGLLIVDEGGNLLFDPNEAFNGLAMDETATLTVDVTLIDPFGGTVTGPLEVVVIGLDGGLIGIDGTIMANEDMISDGLAPDQLADDPEMGAIQIVAIEGGSTAGTDLPEGGRLLVDSSGNLVFDPGDDFQTLAAGEDGPVQQAVVRLRDAGGEEVDATVTITVAGLNDAPDDGMGMLETTEDMVSPGFGTIDASGDIDNGAMLEVVTVNGQPLGEDRTVPLEDGGAIIVAEDGTLVFDPGPDFQGLQIGEADMLEVVVGVADGEGGLGEVTVEIDVTGLNDAPVAVDDGPLDTTAVGTTNAPVLDNDFDPEDDPIRVISVSESTAGGQVTIGEDGVLVFDPGLDFLRLGETEVVEFSVEYEITDGLDGFDTAFATFRIDGVNDTDIARLIDEGFLPPEIITYPVGLIDDDVIDISVVTPDPEIVFGFFNDIGIVVPTLDEEEPITNRGDDEGWLCTGPREEGRDTCLPLVSQ